MGEGSRKNQKLAGLRGRETLAPGGITRVSLLSPQETDVAATRRRACMSAPGLSVPFSPSIGPQPNTLNLRPSDEKVPQQPAQTQRKAPLVRRSAKGKWTPEEVWRYRSETVYLSYPRRMRLCESLWRTTRARTGRRSPRPCLTGPMSSVFIAGKKFSILSW